MGKQKPMWKMLGDLLRDKRRGSISHATRREWSGSEVQSLLFARPQWTPSMAKAWAREHDFRAPKVDVTDDYVRLRQFAPHEGRDKRTITFGDGIKAVIEETK